MFETNKRHTLGEKVFGGIVLGILAFLAVYAILATIGDMGPPV